MKRQSTGWTEKENKTDKDSKQTGQDEEADDLQLESEKESPSQRSNEELSKASLKRPSE